MTDERWRDIAGFEGRYQVSELGRIRSLPRLSAGKRQFRIAGQIMRPGKAGTRGYLKVSLSTGNTIKHKYVHHLVLETFIGPCPPSMEACHFPDPSPANCRLDNLRWDTRSQNRNDSIVMETIARGSGHGRAKLTEADIARIFVLRRSGMTQREIGELVGVNTMQVCRILKRDNWSHVNV